MKNVKRVTKQILSSLDEDESFDVTNLSTNVGTFGDNFVSLLKMSPKELVKTTLEITNEDKIETAKVLHMTRDLMSLLNAPMEVIKKYDAAIKFLKTLKN